MVEQNNNPACSSLRLAIKTGKDIRIAFDANSQSFPLYRIWKILDLANEDWGVEIDITTGSLIDLGWFNPGEGKLFKLKPDLL